MKYQAAFTCPLFVEKSSQLLTTQFFRVLIHLDLQLSQPRFLLTEKRRKPILLKYTDGGTDQRNNLESVRCANICLFREMNLDMLIHVRCGHSWTNPAERIMSILNIGLQSVSLERKEAGREIEMLLKGCNSMSNIREKCSSNATLREG